MHLPTEFTKLELARQLVLVQQRAQYQHLVALGHLRRIEGVEELPGRVQSRLLAFIEVALIGNEAKPGAVRLANRSWIVALVENLGGCGADSSAYPEIVVV
jgi:hypothetical protein